VILNEVHARAVIKHPMLNLQCRLRKATERQQRNNDEFFQHDGVFNEGVPSEGALKQAVTNERFFNEGLLNQGLLNQGLLNKGLLNKGIVNGASPAPQQGAPAVLPAAAALRSQPSADHH